MSFNNAKTILFNTEILKAILDGRKTQTRRVIPLKNNDLIFTGFVVSSTAKNREGYCAFGKNKERALEFIKPKYKVGDILYVREPAKVVSPPVETCKKLTFKYLADNKTTEIFLDNDFDYSKKWIQRCQGVPNGCLKEMARIFLKVTNVRVERLQDISVRDIEKESGWRREIYSYSNKNKAFLRDYCDFWNSTAKDGYRWEDNPYVFVYEFERIHDV